MIRIRSALRRFLSGNHPVNVDYSSSTIKSLTNEAIASRQGADLARSLSALEKEKKNKRTKKIIKLILKETDGLREKKLQYLARNKLLSPNLSLEIKEKIGIALAEARGEARSKKAQKRLDELKESFINALPECQKAAVELAYCKVQMKQLRVEKEKKETRLFSKLATIRRSLAEYQAPALVQSQTLVQAEAEAQQTEAMLQKTEAKLKDALHNTNDSSARENVKTLSLEIIKAETQRDRAQARLHKLKEQMEKVHGKDLRDQLVATEKRLFSQLTQVRKALAEVTTELSAKKAELEKEQYRSGMLEIDINVLKEEVKKIEWYAGWRLWEADGRLNAVSKENDALMKDNQSLFALVTGMQRLLDRSQSQRPQRHITTQRALSPPPYKRTPRRTSGVSP